MNEMEVCLDVETGAPFALNTAGTAAHTAVFAQTGAGKSFLLGRYLEEILLKTRARVVILDPNADFLRFGQPSVKGDSRFADEWGRLPLTTLSNRSGDLGGSAHQAVHRVALDWSRLSPDRTCRYLGFVTPLDYQEYITVAIINRVAGMQRETYSLNDFLTTLRALRDHRRRPDNGDSNPLAGMPDDIDWDLLPENSLLKCSQRRSSSPSFRYGRTPKTRDRSMTWSTNSPRRTATSAS